MKKLLLFVVLMIISITSYAQEKDVTKFLGIPIDGTREEMIAKLKEKGFTPTLSDKNILEGEFNGQEVYIHIVTNGNKMYRIMVAEQIHLNETDIRTRFNILTQQFTNNGKYIAIENAIIPEDEDISYEMSVNNKRYQAAFYQIDKELVDKILLNKFSKEQLENTEQLSLKDQIYIAETYQNSGLHKLVWFMINKFIGKYYISIFYDNTLNKANGEDL